MINTCSTIDRRLGDVVKSQLPKFLPVIEVKGTHGYRGRGDKDVHGQTQILVTVCQGRGTGKDGFVVHVIEILLNYINRTFGDIQQSPWTSLVLFDLVIGEYQVQFVTGAVLRTIFEGR